MYNVHIVAYFLIWREFMEECKYKELCIDKYGECPCEKDKRDCTRCDIYDEWLLVDEPWMGWG